MSKGVNPFLDLAKELVERMQSSYREDQREAVSTIRSMARTCDNNRVAIAEAGGIPPLVSLLGVDDVRIVENVVTALLNLSLNDDNKELIMAAGAVIPLINVLRTGNATARENAAATLFSLTVEDKNKVLIGEAPGALEALLELFANGRPSGKRDAASALFNLSILEAIRRALVQLGAVSLLVDVMADTRQPPLVLEAAVRVAYNLLCLREGRQALVAAGGVAVLVEMAEEGSESGKETAAAALLRLCQNNTEYLQLAFSEGAMAPLVTLSQTGTARGKKKASLLLDLVRKLVQQESQEREVREV